MSTPTPDLPDLHEAMLDAARLERLFFDVAHAAEAIEVRVKARSTAPAAGGATSLSAARDLLLRGEAAGVQIRYRYGGAGWMDTVLRVPGGFRLVRMAGLVVQGPR